MSLELGERHLCQSAGALPTNAANAIELRTTSSPVGTAARAADVCKTDAGGTKPMANAAMPIINASIVRDKCPLDCVVTVCASDWMMWDSMKND